MHGLSSYKCQDASSIDLETKKLLYQLSFFFGLPTGPLLPTKNLHRGFYLLTRFVLHHGVATLVPFVLPEPEGLRTFDDEIPGRSRLSSHDRR